MIERQCRECGSISIERDEGITELEQSRPAQITKDKKV